jgi:hypothetical protein
MVLALDWAKAFDSISPSAMIVALRRFGVTEHVLRVTQAIYSERSFKVVDCSQKSRQHAQNAGISQGCPLSPFLFVMIMTILMRDATESLSNTDKQLLERGGLTELLYADDTLLLSVNSGSLERLLAAVSDAGARYGLELHWGKLQLMRVRCEDTVRKPEGGCIESKPGLSYLGTVISEDGRIGKELARRIGAAHSDFRSLVRLWRHTSVRRVRKLEIFNAVIVSRLLYGLSSAWLNTSERRRLDGFQNRCLRSIWGIAPSFISRVSNQHVLDATSQMQMSRSLLKLQLEFFVKVALAPDESLLRQVTFCPGRLWPVIERYVRKPGRPRLEWTSQVHQAAIRLAGDSLESCIVDSVAWKGLLDAAFRK